MTDRQTPKVGKLIARMLTAKRQLPYDKIAEKVRAKVPEAHTSARSVASVACSLRASGVPIPDHRRANAQ